MQRRRKYKSTPPKRTFEATIDEIGAKGDGVATVNGEQIYVPYTAPHDVAKIEAEGQKGRLLGLLQTGPDRTEPPCPLYARCGGCALQHVTSEFYRNWKQEQVKNAIAAAGITDVPLTEMIAVEPSTRRRAQFYVQRSGNDVALGFYERRSRNLVELDACLVLHLELEAKLGALKNLAAAAPKNWAASAMAVTLCRNGLDVNFVHKQPLDEPSFKQTQYLIAVMKSAGVIRVAANGDILATLATPIVMFDGIAVAPPAGGFLQAGETGQEALIDLVVSAASGAKKIVDLFSGCGTFSLPLAKGATVAAYDSDARAIEALKSAAAVAQNTGLNPVHAEARNLFERPMSTAELNEFDTIVIDPPRAGAIHQAREIAVSNVPFVISVSCNPKTFARDAKILVDGGYQLTNVTPVDQFVFSPHIEIMGLFARK